MTLLTMYDAIDVTQIPADAAFVAGYVGGKWPTAAELPARFPHARLFTIAVTAAEDAECLDIETGDATPADAAAWSQRQRGRGVARPCLYADAYTMKDGVLPALYAADVSRASVRLWSAHYTGTAHICGPSSCGLVSIAMDGTQWTDTAMGRTLDQSLLAADFFTAPAPPAVPRPWTTAGLDSLASLAQAHGTDPSTILRMTAEHSPGSVFPANVAGYANEVFGRDSRPMPAGLALWLPG